VILERLIGYGLKKLKTILWQVLRKLYNKNQRNEQFSKLIFFLISYTFRTSWVHLQEECYVCIMVCLTCINVSGLVGNIAIRLVIKKENILLPTRLLTPMNVQYTILNNAVFLRMNPQGSKHVGNIRN